MHQIIAVLLYQSCYKQFHFEDPHIQENSIVKFVSYLLEMLTYDNTVTPWK